MQNVKRSFGAVSKGGVLKRVCCGPKKLGSWVGYTASGEPSPPPLGVIEVIHVASIGTLVTKRRGVLAVVQVESCPDEQPSEKRLKLTREPISFNDVNLEEMI